MKPAASEVMGDLLSMIHDAYLGRGADSPARSRRELRAGRFAGLTMRT
jgi:hypothetical protein